MNATKTTTAAEDAYLAAFSTALTLLEKIGQAIEDQPAPGTGTKIHWGHVGSLNHLNEVLDDALAFITNRE